MMKIRKQTEARITVSRMASFGIRDGFKPTLRVDLRGRTLRSAPRVRPPAGATDAGGCPF